MDDPETWERPWTFEVPMKALDGEKWEYACHEGTTRCPMLGGARALEAREEAGGAAVTRGWTRRTPTPPAGRP